ncbi:unnamed protein product [Thelazia callipaeda]|uniref:UBC core domain-containing protein n=1 Tax=Thelazia callipaeda TaxID=103827 RepID=A0A0N5D162_THECL|nr:unnamed protein product [Thelazia callipaeda]
MALMYPMHFPTVPLRWDEAAWTIPCTDAIDELLLSRLESLISMKSKISQMRAITNATSGNNLMQEGDDLEEDEEDVADEDDEQNQ